MLGSQVVYPEEIVRLMPWFVPRREYNAGPVKLLDSTSGGTVASFSVSSIPATYSALQIMLSGRSAEVETEDTVLLRFNGDTGGNYDHGGNSLINSGAFGGVLPAAAHAATYIPFGILPAALATAGYFGTSVATLPNYSAAIVHMLTGQGVYEVSTAGNSWYVPFSGQWRTANAITQVTLALLSGSNFANLSRCTILGIP